MSRNIKAKSLILKINPVGENHRGLCMLVSGEGLLRPLAFGAQSRRSALRGTAVPFSTGLAGLHFDGVKNSWRLTSFDPLNIHEGLRENLERFYTATGWAEILLGSHGAGADSAQLYTLAEIALNCLSDAAQEKIIQINIAFLWHYLNIEGVQPDIQSCGQCARKLPIGNPIPAAQFQPDGLLTCHDCAGNQGRQIFDGARAWLLKVSNHFSKALSIGLNANAAASAQSWLILLIQSHLGRHLSVISGLPGEKFRSWNSKKNSKS